MDLAVELYALALGVHTWCGYDSRHIPGPPQLEGDLVEAVTALKADAFIRQIALSGSTSVVRQLLQAGLVHELNLFVHPATAGGGLRLFEDDTPAQHLRLLSATPFATDVVHLVYAPDPNPPTGDYDSAKGNLFSD